MNCCKVLSWNIRGMGKAKNKRNLRNLISKHQPNILCIQETMISFINDKDLETIWKIREVQAIFQEASGHSGGLIIGWNSGLFEMTNWESMQNA